MDELEVGNDGKFADERNGSSKQKPITRRESQFIRHLLEGNSIADAARKAGYSESVALDRASGWIGQTREESKKPHLYDEYKKHLNRILRLHDVKVESILDELKIIAFSSIDNFIDLPTRESLLKARKNDAKTREFIGIITEEDEKILKDESISLDDYRPGSEIRLKFLEDIPKQLIPAIWEIHETKDGIRIKLHSKMDAIDKLMRYMKMFDGESGQGNDTFNLTQVNIVVNGSKSPLMGNKLDESDQA